MGSYMKSLSLSLTKLVIVGSSIFYLSNIIGHDWHDCRLPYTMLLKVSLSFSSQQQRTDDRKQNKKQKQAVFIWSYSGYWCYHLGSCSYSHTYSVCKNCNWPQQAMIVSLEILRSLYSIYTQFSTTPQFLQRSSNISI